MQNPLQFYRANYENAVILLSKHSTWTFKNTELFCGKIVFEMKNSPSRLIYDIAPLYNSAQTSVKTRHVSWRSRALITAHSQMSVSCTPLVKTSIHRVLYPILSHTNNICFVYINVLCSWIAVNTTTAPTTTITLTTTTTTQQFSELHINASYFRKMLILNQVYVVTLHLMLICTRDGTLPLLVISNNFEK